MGEMSLAEARRARRGEGSQTGSGEYPARLVAVVPGEVLLGIP